MRYLLLLFCIFLLFGGTETKPKVEDYEVHARAKNVAIGAEYTVHSFSRGEQMFIANDYLVVEVALFTPKGTAFDVQRGDFSLRINKKEPLDAAEPRYVVADMEHPEWKPQRDGLHSEGTVGLGNIGVAINPPQANPNPFPGSRTSGPPPRLLVFPVPGQPEIHQDIGATLPGRGFETALGARSVVNWCGG